MKKKIEKSHDRYFPEDLMKNLETPGKTGRLGRLLNVTSTNRNIWTIVSLHSPKLLYFWSGRVGSRWQEPSRRNGLRKRRKKKHFRLVPSTFLSLWADVNEKRSFRIKDKKCQHCESVCPKSEREIQKHGKLRLVPQEASNHIPVWYNYCQHANTMFPLDEKWIKYS